jgi:hypothetical protein
MAVMPHERVGRERTFSVSHVLPQAITDQEGKQSIVLNEDEKKPKKSEILTRVANGAYRFVRGGLILIGAAGYYTLVGISHLVPAIPKIAFGALIGNFLASQYLNIPIAIALGVTSPVSSGIFIATLIGAGIGLAWHAVDSYGRSNA